VKNVFKIIALNYFKYNILKGSREGVKARRRIRMVGICRQTSPDKET
jgi:hypothetical protein